jgi:hypothetical protein
MHPKAIAIVSVAALILGSMPSSAHEHGKTTRIESSDQLVSLEVSVQSTSWGGQRTPQQNSQIQKPTEPEIQRTEAGIHIIGTPFLPPLNQ